MDIAIICGGRNYDDRNAIRAFLGQLDPKQVLVMTGRAPGTDTLTDYTAGDLGFDRINVPANWKGSPGRSGGPLRNGRMLTYAKAITVALGGKVTVYAFPGGTGTANMLQQARDAGVHTETIGWESP